MTTTDATTTAATTADATGAGTSAAGTSDTAGSTAGTSDAAAGAAGTSDAAGATAVRGDLAYFTGDPFTSPLEECFVHVPDGMVVMRDGRITAVGRAADLAPGLPAGTRVDHHPGCLVGPGFIDAHVHYAQTGMIASHGGRLIDWLNDHTFPAERALADPAVAADLAAAFVAELVRNGTTTALTFATVHRHSADALFAAAAAVDMRIIAGKVLMDRNAPADLLDDPRRGYEESRDLIRAWHGRGRAGYAITPRFAPTSSPEQLRLAGELWREFPDVHVHSHLAENVDEVHWVAELFPERKGYLDVYHHHGLTGRRAVYAHAVHLGEEDFGLCHDTGTALAHCPTSNTFLGSGLFPLHEAKAAERPVHVGLGTDVGGGTTFSLPTTMGEAYKVAQLRGRDLDPLRSLYLATLGNARALDIDRHVGTLAPGLEADLVVLDPRATPLLARRTARAESVADVVFALAVLADDRVVRRTYVAGRPVDPDRVPAP